MRRAEKGDAKVLESLAVAGRHLGIALAAAVNIFDVDVVVLGGCFGPLAPWLADDVGSGAAQARALVGLDGLRGARVGVRRGRCRPRCSGD